MGSDVPELIRAFSWDKCKKNRTIMEDIDLKKADGVSIDFNLTEMKELPQLISTLFQHRSH